MAYTLIGSKTSPYVRRIRLYLRDIPYSFDAVNIVDPAEDARLSRINPIKRIPVLMIDDRPLFESRVIFNYLQKTHGRPSLSLAEENLVSTIDAWQDQLIQGFLLKRGGHPVDGQNSYYQRMAERQKLVTTYLASAIVKGEFSRWDYPAMSLYSLLDWASFRETIDMKTAVPALQTFYESAAVQPAVAATDPRQV
ncbi:MAG: glutathione S-transferase family protein [Deltaproteobacteria bacterium]|nr:glutathione S-transferase family protein [Deltaproteobacteria bacterium]